MKSLLQSFVIARSCERRGAERVELIFAWNHRPNVAQHEAHACRIYRSFCFTLSRETCRENIVIKVHHECDKRVFHFFCKNLIWGLRITWMGASTATVPSEKCKFN